MSVKLPTQNHLFITQNTRTSYPRSDPNLLTTQPSSYYTFKPCLFAWKGGKREIKNNTHSLLFMGHAPPFSFSRGLPYYHPPFLWFCMSSPTTSPRCPQKSFFEESRSEILQVFFNFFHHFFVVLVENRGWKGKRFPLLLVGHRHPKSCKTRENLGGGGVGNAPWERTFSC